MSLSQGRRYGAYILAAVGVAELIAFARGTPVPAWYRLTAAGLSFIAVAWSVREMARALRELRQLRKETRAMLAAIARAENARNN